MSCPPPILNIGGRVDWHFQWQWHLVSMTLNWHQVIPDTKNSFFPFATVSLYHWTIGIIKNYIIFYMYIIIYFYAHKNQQVWFSKVWQKVFSDLLTQSGSFSTLPQKGSNLEIQNTTKIENENKIKQTLSLMVRAIFWKDSKKVNLFWIVWATKLPTLLMYVNVLLVRVYL